MTAHSTDGTPGATERNNTVREQIFFDEIKQLQSRHEQVLSVLRKIVNLSSHPYFPTVKDLPAWDKAIDEARNLL